MSLHNVVRVKPAKPPSRSRIRLHAIDQVPVFFTPLNLFFKPSPSGPTQLRDFAGSLQDVLDRFPLIAGSIYEVEDMRGVKSKELVDDGRGADLIWVQSPTAYVADIHESADLTPRPVLGNQENTDQTLLMVKFTKFTCDTLVMGISVSHMFADCTSYINLIKEWARVSRGGSMSDALTVTSWDRHPEAFFPPPTPGAIPYGMRLPTGVSPPHPHAYPKTMSSFFFTWESLCELKRFCTPADPNAWVSTGDCVGAVLWRALTTARIALLEPDRDVHLYMAVDGRSRSKMQPNASKYFGNLVTPITVTLSQSTLLEGSLASVALACRRAMDEQLTEANCANMLALFDSVRTIPRVCDTNMGDSRISNWTKYPLVGEALDFGGGAPFWESAGQFPPGQILILPERDGYVGSLMIETNWAGRLQAIDELVTYSESPIPL